MTRTVDFDAFRAEQNKESVHFKIGDKIYELPPALPAAIAVDVIRLRAAQGDEAEVPLDVLETFGQGLFGKEMWAQLLGEHRITMSEVPRLLEMVLEVYTEDPKVPETEAQTSTTPASVSA
jgi:hypothetical protein